jgi:CRP/FNR family transcriptional regulator, cyclic AMP receptor protein
MEHNLTESRLLDLAFMQGFSTAHLHQIAQVATLVQWDTGTSVFREGDRDSFLYVIEEGRVAIEIAVPGRGRVVILTVGAGEVFGWSSMFRERPKTASARTIEAAKAFALDASRLRELCDADPQLGYLLTRRILDVVSERLKATRMQLLDIYSP